MNWDWFNVQTYFLVVLLLVILSVTNDSFNGNFEHWFSVLGISNICGLLAGASQGNYHTGRR